MARQPLGSMEAEEMPSVLKAYQKSSLGFLLDPDSPSGPRSLDA